MKTMKLSRRHGLGLALGMLVGMVVPGWAHADGLDALSQFIKQTRAGRAQFTQVVTSPARQGQAPRSKTSSGSFEFQRPGKFRFDYRKPFVQTLVADGQTLWLHDVDSDLDALKVDFGFKNEADRDGLQWVRATPKKTEGQIQSVLVGLRSTDKGVELAVLDVQDSLGQRSVLSFSAFELNPSLGMQSFVFRVPAGADVIRP
jgi:outer membrane lipoprotein carrier protein